MYRIRLVTVDFNRLLNCKISHDALSSPNLSPVVVFPPPPAVCPVQCKHRACTKDDQCCHEQCLGGCLKPDSAGHCVACRGLQHEGTCVDRCPETHLTFKGWRCVSFAFCQELHNQCKREKEHSKKADCQEYVIHNGACIPECPSGYTIVNSST